MNVLNGNFHLNQIFKFSNKIAFESFKNNLLYEFNNNF